MSTIYDVTLKGKAGAVAVSDGSESQLKLDNQGNLTTVFDHGDYQEAVARGRVMAASNAVAGVAPGTAFSTTPPFAIWNPATSSKRLSILKTFIAYLSGTLGAGFVAYGWGLQTTVPTGGTELTPINCLIGESAGTGRAFTGSTFAATPAIIVAPFAMAPALATTTSFPYIVEHDVKGAICIGPGTAVCMEMTGGAGTSPKVVFGAIWEEVPA